MAPTNPPVTGADITTAADLLAAIEAGTAKIYAYTDTGTIQAPGILASEIKTLLETNYDRDDSVTIMVNPNVHYYTAVGAVFTDAGYFAARTELNVSRKLYRASNKQYSYYKILEGTYVDKYIRHDDTNIGTTGGI